MGKHNAFSATAMFHYAVITIVLGLYHFYIGMPILDVTYGFWLYWIGFFLVLVGIDVVLHKVLGLD